MLALDYGNLPQWISAGSAFVLVVGAVVLLAHGRRTDIGVTAEVRQLSGKNFLDICVTMSPVGSLRNRPYGVVGCGWCNESRIGQARHGQLPDDEMWLTLHHCPGETADPHYGAIDLRLPTPRKRGRGMTRRRVKWGCTNRKVPLVEIFEVCTNPSNEADQLQIITEKSIIRLMNAFHGEYAEPHERLQFTHVVPVPASGPSVIGWRAVLTLEIPRETWFLRHPSKDSWVWKNDDFAWVPQIAGTT